MGMLDRIAGALRSATGIMRPKAGANVIQTGGFEGGMSARRLRSFTASRSHVNTLLQGAGRDMTARARFLVRNNGYAVNAVEGWTAAVVGTGIKPLCTLKDERLREAVHELWTAWTDDSDAEGVTDFYGQQRRAAREGFIAGESLIRFRDRRPEDGLAVPFQLQLIPSEMLTWDNLPGTRGTFRHGIEFDAIGQRTAYRFYRRHPNDITERIPNNIETVDVPAQQVVHLHDPMDAGQLRGVSRFAPAIAKLFLLDQYDDAELDRKKVAAMFAGFVTKAAPDEGDPDEETDDSGDPLMPLEPGLLQRLGLGESVEFAEPADVGGNYEVFQYRTLLQVSAALGIPYQVMTNDVLKANYANQRAGLIEFRRRVEAFQHAVVIRQMCRPTWARFWDAAVLAGLLPISITDYTARRAEILRAVKWQPPAFEWIDPLKDIQAQIWAVRAAFESRDAIVMQRGQDPEQLDREIAASNARADRLGLMPDTDPRYMSKGGITQAKPAGTGFVDPMSRPAETTEPPPDQPPPTTP